MGEVQVINKSRKEFKCGKCGQVIPKGSKYYRGEVNFGPTFIRCEKCGLKHWEVTSSDYLLSVGPIVYEWAENYSLDEDGIASIISDIEEIIDELESRLDNIPEQLQDADAGQLLQERIDGLESARDELESIDIGSMQEDALSSFFDGFEWVDDYGMSTDCPFDEDLLEDWDNAETALKDNGMDDVWEDLVSEFESALSDDIESAIGEIQC